MSEDNSSGFICLICSGQLVWQNDYSLSDLTENPDDEGIVSFFSCMNCGARIEAIYDVKNDNREQSSDSHEQGESDSSQ